MSDWHLMLILFGSAVIFSALMGAFILVWVQARMTRMDRRIDELPRRLPAILADRQRRTG